MTVKTHESIRLHLELIRQLLAPLSEEHRQAVMGALTGAEEACSTLRIEILRLKSLNESATSQGAGYWLQRNDARRRARAWKRLARLKRALLADYRITATQNAMLFKQAKLRAESAEQRARALESWLRSISKSACSENHHLEALEALPSARGK